MVGRLAARFASVAVLALIGCFLVFVMGYFGPGDPVRTILGQTWATPAEHELLRQNLGLDRPLLVQFVSYLGDALRGDLGTSWQRGRPVSDLIGQGLGITLQLTVASILLMVVLGIPLGLLAALRHNKATDRAIVLVTTIVHAVPPYVVAPILMVIFVLTLGILSVPIGWDGIFSPGAIIPVLTLTVGPLVFVVRQTRNSVLEVLSEDFVRTATAMGLSRAKTIVSHVLPNAMGPVVNQLGLGFGGLFVNTVFVETIFNIPGFGSLLFRAVTGDDYPLLVGATVVAIVVISAAYFLTDVVQALIDRRIEVS